MHRHYRQFITEVTENGPIGSRVLHMFEAHNIGQTLSSLERLSC